MVKDAELKDKLVGFRGVVYGLAGETGPTT